MTIQYNNMDLQSNDKMGFMYRKILKENYTKMSYYFRGNSPQSLMSGHLL